MTHAPSSPFAPRSVGCCRGTAADRSAASPLHAQTVAVMVNGEPITNYDIEQRSKLNFLTTHKHCRPQASDQRTDRRKGEDQGRQEIRRRSRRFRHRSVLRRDERADADHAGSTDQIARKPGHSAGNAEGPHQGRYGLDQPGARTIQGKPAGRRKGRRRRRPGSGRRKTAGRSVRIQDAADRADRAARIGAGRHRGETEGSRSAAQPRAELRRGERASSNRCTMPRSARP